MTVPGEGNAEGPSGGDVDGGVVRVVTGDWDGPALWMDALLSLTVPAVKDGVLETFVDRREGDVVVQELSELHYHESVAGVWVRNVIVNGGGDGAWRWQ